MEPVLLAPRNEPPSRETRSVNHMTACCLLLLRASIYTSVQQLSGEQQSGARWSNIHLYALCIPKFHQASITLSSKPGKSPRHRSWVTINERQKHQVHDCKCLTPISNRKLPSTRLTRCVVHTNSFEPVESIKPSHPNLKGIVRLTDQAQDSPERNSSCNRSCSAAQ